jgi:hypothetical protein
VPNPPPPPPPPQTVTQIMFTFAGTVKFPFAVMSWDFDLPPVTVFVNVPTFAASVPFTGEVSPAMRAETVMTPLTAPCTKGVVRRA